MELETVQGTRLRTLMETWRDNINDCNIVCTPEGIMSTAMDPAHVSLAHFKIFASGVESYSCTGTYLLGINTSYFHKYIKNIAHHHDMLKLKYDPAVPDVLSIQIRSEGSGPREAEMKLLALDEPEDNHIPEQGYNTVLSMVSAELTKIIREMANNADKVWISCTQSAEGPKVKFTSDGEAGRLTYTVNHGQDEADLVLQSDIHMQVGHELPLVSSNRCAAARASTPPGLAAQCRNVHRMRLAPRCLAARFRNARSRAETSHDLLKCPNDRRSLCRRSIPWSRRSRCSLNASSNRMSTPDSQRRYSGPVVRTPKATTPPAMTTFHTTRSSLGPTARQRKPPRKDIARVEPRILSASPLGIIIMSTIIGR